MRQLAKRLGGVGATALLLATVGTLGTAPPAQAAGARGFSASVPGARFTGGLEWQEGPNLSSRAFIYNAHVEDTAGDDYRAVAYIHYELVPLYEGNCNDLGCQIIKGPRSKHDVYVANATPKGDVSQAYWDYQDTWTLIENVWVQVCTEQWRYTPHKKIACSGWR
ncbi:hypothetical protein H9Y04_25475 [Streptomyces sp. TRM66268-LWL]|uniref:Lipoprotein n=1 Tax=Streptomyces polyasparticus TaxID=2767826 RepID=A0ABR7SK99_9ACTN|nr:hypothetical protein [Streptomyces polyasparticus]MBC9715895.1 hypothetical protein [Streptomyces polyasparticus]